MPVLMKLQPFEMKHQITLGGGIKRVNAAPRNWFYNRDAPDSSLSPVLGAIRSSAQSHALNTAQTQHVVRTRPVRSGIHTPVRWGILHLGTIHRWAQKGDQSVIWLKGKEKQ